MVSLPEVPGMANFCFPACGDDKILAGLARFYFRIYNVTCKPAQCMSVPLEQKDREGWSCEDCRVEKAGLRKSWRDGKRIGSVSSRACLGAPAIFLGLGRGKTLGKRLGGTLTGFWCSSGQNSAKTIALLYPYAKYSCKTRRKISNKC